VCGTDFSDSGKAAVRSAAALAARLGAPLWLVHVVDAGIEYLDTRARDLLVSAAEQRLQQESRRLPPAVRRRAETKVLVGTPHDALVAVPGIPEPGLVVVASQGHAPSPLFRLGGTSEHVAATSSAPVLVVRDAAPFEAWARRVRPLRVVLGVDFAAGSEAAIQWTKELRRAAPCDLTVAHVYYADEAQRRYGRPARSPLSSDPEVERMLSRDLAARVGDIPGQGTVSFRAYRGMGRLADHLLEVAQAEQADLVVVGTHQRRGVARLASVSSGVLHMGRMAVAVIPAREEAPLRTGDVPVVRRVLITTDFSATANRAIPHGYGLLAARGGDVHLLHVVERGRAGRSAASEGDLRRRLEALVPAMPGRLGDIATHTEIAHGAVARAIREAAERLGVDVICMASHGRTGLAKTLLGSVAGAVLMTSRRPVLVVRPPVE
jgi:nucleotide-binding universal stress UspA family protein